MNFPAAECMCGKTIHPKPLISLGPYLSIWISCEHCGLDLIATLHV